MRAYAAHFLHASKTDAAPIRYGLSLAQSLQSGGVDIAHPKWRLFRHRHFLDKSAALRPNSIAP